MFGGFVGADGLVGVGFEKELKDGVFEGGVFFSGVAAAAGFAAEFDDVPVLLVFSLPLDEAAAGLAELVFVGSGAVGFGFAVGHLG